MIFTVFCAPALEAMQRPAELLEFSWGKVRQPGELLRLAPTRPGVTAPRHRFARVVETLCWCPHPYSGDDSPSYDTPASLLEWLFTERVHGTILLVAPGWVFRSAVDTEVSPGRARATAWPELPRGDGPFGLGRGFDFLELCCVDRKLELAAVAPPLAIHSTDLLRMAARWLELISIVRAETAIPPDGPRLDADRIAYAIAAAEAGIGHDTAEFPVVPDAHASAASLAAEYDARRQISDLAFLRPQRGRGVREGRVLDSVFLEIPGRSDTLSLNPSGAAIWALIDGKRTLAEVMRELEQRYDVPAASLRADVDSVIARLQQVGALKLEPA